MRRSRGHNRVIERDVSAGGPDRLGQVAAAVLALAAAIALPTPARADKAIALVSSPVPLNPDDRGQAVAGSLLYRGGIAVKASDRRFGGLSGLFISPDGQRMVAITDRGSRVTARLRYDGDGRLAGLTDGRLGPLRDPLGRPLRGLRADAEALTFLPDGSALVAFERDHRIYRYPAAKSPLSSRPTLWTVPVGLAGAPANGGIEALTHVGRRFLFLLTEKLRVSGRNLAGWVGRDRNWEPFAYRRTAGFRPSDATLLPGGDIAVLERRYTLVKGSAARIVVIPRRSIGPGRAVAGREILRLAAPLTVDNFEGISARRGDDRRIVIYIVSDDNFNPLQRTLLMMFEMP